MTIQLSRGTHEMEVYEGANLLLEAASRGIDIPFRCTTGRCGTCRVRVTAGMDNLSDHTELELFHMDESELAQGGRLACQSYIHGDVTIKVESE